MSTFVEPCEKCGGFGFNIVAPMHFGDGEYVISCESCDGRGLWQTPLKHETILHLLADGRDE